MNTNGNKRETKIALSANVYAGSKLNENQSTQMRIRGVLSVFNKGGRVLVPTFTASYTTIYCGILGEIKDNTTIYCIGVFKNA